MTQYLQIASVVLGWTYFICWSMSFYPQAILNYRRKRVDDFATLNPISFACYAIYSSNFYFNGRIREQYRQRHDGQDNAVMLNDVAFAVHAFLLASTTLAQTYWYPRARGQALSTYNRIVLNAFFTLLLIDFVMVVAGVQPGIDFLYHLSYFKLYVTFAKYVPQAYVNWTRKSTAGFSIEAILLDLSGGLLSLIQSLLIAFIEDNWSSILGNPVKLGLSILSLCFPSIFVFQHFVLYRTRSKDAVLRQEEGERTPLLG
ncbi:hypothetical protein FRB99_005051 [Tulasnella sp. 403]|nr:hypothetical protein FRB99_005051 [Tulasnella sp. 403]